jgi:hypothetical protein
MSLGEAGVASFCTTVSNGAQKGNHGGVGLGSAAADGSAEKLNALATPGPVPLGFLSMRRVAAKLRHFHHPLTSGG